MKKRILFVGSLTIFLFLAACGKGAVGSDVDGSVTLDSDDPLSIYAANLIPQEQASLADFPTATRYELDLALVEPYASIAGQEKVTYWNNEEAALSEIYLRMFPNNSGDLMQVTLLKVNGEESEFTVEFNNTALRVDLPEPLQPAEMLTLELSYTVEVPTDFGGNYGLFSYIDGILALDQVYCIIPVYDDEGWNVETPPPNGDMIYADPSFFTVTVHAPADLLVAATGVVVDEKEEDGVRTQTFAAGPVRDFYIAASTVYETLTQQVGETLVTSYFPKGSSKGGQHVLTVGVNALETFNARFGTYPYTELDLVGTPMQAGGMEYSGILAMATDYYDPDAVYYGLPAFSLLESATAHEVAHEWFFNMVMSDQLDEPWIDEGMAQYLTYLYFENTFGPSAAGEYIESWNYRWDRVEFLPIPIGMPVREYVDNQYGAIIYGRAPLFIHDLRQKMGDEVFFDFMRALFEEHKWGIATTESFRALAEETCDCDLKQAFDNWVYPR